MRGRPRHGDALDRSASRVRFIGAVLLLLGRRFGVVLDLARKHPEFLAGVSIHPARRDAIDGAPRKEREAVEQEPSEENQQSAPNDLANQRAVVTLRDVAGWSSEEVCNALELTETNQRVLLHRARAKVRRALEEYFDDQEGAEP